jgi:predicted ATP-grasp superfamily ATP-dependent carboligase
VNNFLSKARATSDQAAVERGRSVNDNLSLHPVKYDALVLDARLRQSLVTVRSLGSRRLHVAAMETSTGTPTFSSRWCQQAFVCPTDGSAETYLTNLKQVLDHTGARVLIVSTDGSAELIRRHREELEQRVHIALAKNSALEIALSKERTLEVARQLGLVIPRAITVETVSDVEPALREIGLPAVVKPVQSWIWSEQQGTGLACKLVATPDEAKHAVEELTNHGVKALFQQFLSGKREAVSFLYAGGQMYARFAQWAKRTQPQLGGTSVLRQGIAIPPDIGEQAERLLREINLEGYSEVEFRRDSEGNPYLMEINPRLSASVEIAVRSGVDFPYLLYQWASGERIDTVNSYRTGHWMRYLRGDYETTREAMRQSGRPGVPSPSRALLDFLLTFFIPMRYDYLDWKDPYPAWIEGVDFARFVLSGLSKFL